MYKGPMGKAKRGKIEGGKWGWVGQEKVVVEKRRQLYLKNNNKKNLTYTHTLFYITLFMK